MAEIATDSLSHAAEQTAEQNDQPVEMATGRDSAARCYDCGRQHPAWVEKLLLGLWDDREWTADETARMDAFSQAEHGGCFQ